MNRRQLVARGSLAAAALAVRHPRLFAAHLGSRPSTGTVPCILTTDDPGLHSIYDAALATLAGNAVQFPAYSEPVLVEGSVYHGVWLECAPQEGEVYNAVGPEAANRIARANQLIFFSLQKEDGQLPCSVKANGPAFGQIQMVVPIAATAWELARQFRDSELLEKAYAACGRWDAWLRRYRNTRGTGLCEGFCTYDTGQDNSPRWKGIPNACPDHDARKCPDAPGLPRLCPDLSATVYGGRVALAAMAKALGKTGEADRWMEDAETIRRLILERLYDPQDGAFYDLDAQNHFVRIRSSTILTVLGEHVPDAATFETVWQKQVHNPEAFRAPYPFPSVALDDPQFVRPIPRNSWGGATQALTALRAPRWMEHYGKPSELAWLMERWLEALRRANGEFRQQMDPLTGAFTLADPGGYSPAALVFLDFLWRLSGVRQQDDLIEWNVRSPSARGQSKFSRQIGSAIADLSYGSSHADLHVSGRRIARVSGIVRLLTTRDGGLQTAVGIVEGEQPVAIRAPGRATSAFSIAPDARVDLRASQS
jgi:Mannosylglycerate hydrolase MGH1-like glycoside hydrolase domain